MWTIPNKCMKKCNVPKKKRLVIGNNNFLQNTVVWRKNVVRNKSDFSRTRIK